MSSHASSSAWRASCSLSHAAAWVGSLGRFCLPRLAGDMSIAPMTPALLAFARALSSAVAAFRTVSWSPISLSTSLAYRARLVTALRRL